MAKTTWWVVGCVILLGGWESLSPIQGAEELLTNQQVIEMLEAGLGIDLVAKKIESVDNAFDVSPQALVELKRRNVPDSVIDLMLQRYTAQYKKLRSRIALDIQHLADESPDVQSAAFLSLQRVGPTAYPQLRDALSSTRPPLRREAARTLGRLGDQESAPLLMTLLIDPDSSVRSAAAEALALLQHRPAIELARKIVVGGEPPLDGYLRLLGYAKDPQHVGFIRIRLLEDHQVETRVAAAWALGMIGSPQGREALEHALTKDRTPEVRRAAAVALGQLALPESIDLLKRQCAKDPDARQEILAALARYDASQSVAFLIDTLRQKLTPAELETVLGGLRKLTHQDFGPDPLLWDAWWEKHRKQQASSAELPSPSSATTEQSPTPPTDSTPSDEEDSDEDEKAKEEKDVPAE